MQFSPSGCSNLNCRLLSSPQRVGQRSGRPMVIRLLLWSPTKHWRLLSWTRKFNHSASMEPTWTPISLRFKSTLSSHLRLGLHVSSFLDVSRWRLCTHLSSQRAAFLLKTPSPYLLALTWRVKLRLSSVWCFLQSPITFTLTFPKAVLYSQIQ